MRQTVASAAHEFSGRSAGRSAPRPRASKAGRPIVRCECSAELAAVVVLPLLPPPPLAKKTSKTHLPCRAMIGFIIGLPLGHVRRVALPSPMKQKQQQQQQQSAEQTGAALTTTTTKAARRWPMLLAAADVCLSARYSPSTAKSAQSSHFPVCSADNCGAHMLRAGAVSDVCFLWLLMRMRSARLATCATIAALCM